MNKSIDKNNIYKKKSIAKYFVSPVIVASIASLLYIVDALLAQVFVAGGSFMWVAFVSWTVFGSATMKDRIKAVPGFLIGFLAACAMMAITSSFSANIYTISISCLLGVFLLNGAVMFFENGAKVWLNSISGIFCGIFLTFSGLGVGLNPLNSWKECFITLGIIVVYGILGLACGWLNGTLASAWKKRLPEDNSTQELSVKATNDSDKI